MLPLQFICNVLVVHKYKSYSPEASSYVEKDVSHEKEKVTACDTHTACPHCIFYFVVLSVYQQQKNRSKPYRTTYLNLRMAR